jgi:hypothetical protein
MVPLPVGGHSAAAQNDSRLPETGYVTRDIMQTSRAQNTHYPKIIHFYVAFHAVLLIAVSVGLWCLAARSSRHAVAPNTHLGFRSQHTLVSAQGWFVAQRVGFRFAAIAVTIVAAVVLAVVALAYGRRLNTMWLLIIPVIGGPSHTVAPSSRAGPAGILSDLHPPRAAIMAERFTFVAAVRGIASTNSTVLGAL